MFGNEEREQQIRVDRRIMDTASNVGVRHRLPQQIHILVIDDVTGLRFGAFAGIEYFDDGSGQFKITRTLSG